jgi:hypothetical protein
MTTTSLSVTVKSSNRLKSSANLSVITVFYETQKTKSKKQLKLGSFYLF